MASIYRPPWRIDFERRPGVASPLAATALATLAARTLTAAGAPSPASLGLFLSDDRELATLNADHMGKDGPTDVLSFPLLPPQAFPQHPGKAEHVATGTAGSFVLPAGRRPHLGDIVISVERARAQAATTVADELRQLLVHGVLHICGWDHADPAERDAMRRFERDLLTAP